MTKGITRRAFFKFAAASLAMLGLPAKRLIAATSGPGELDMQAAWQLGRAIYGIPVRTSPSWTAPLLYWLQPESVFTILGTMMGDRPNRYNDVWYFIPGGYIYSGWVQPMINYGPQPVEREIPEWGFWGEICRPHASARKAPSNNAQENYQLVYSSVHHVMGMVDDPAGGSWYQLYDELPPTDIHWVRTQHVRRLSEWEFRPINSHIPLGQKRIEIDIKGQSLVCYEGEQAVFFTRCASGARFDYDDGTSEDFSTPKGEHVVLLKQPSRHMKGGIEGEDDFFDLPGVPWNTFFTYQGIAIHGTYWHNDFGIQRSHGCVNVSPDAARWIYRWTYPIAPYEDDYVQSDWTIGTRIIVL